MGRVTPARGVAFAKSPGLANPTQSGPTMSVYAITRLPRRRTEISPGLIQIKAAHLPIALVAPRWWWKFGGERASGGMPPLHEARRTRERQVVPMAIPSTVFSDGSVPVVPYDKLREHIQDGDLLLCSGSATFSKLIKVATHSTEEPAKLRAQYSLVLEP